MGHLFYRGVAPSEIKAMGWKELAYWVEWSKKISETEAKALEG